MCRKAKFMALLRQPDISFMLRLGYSTFWMKSCAVALAFLTKVTYHHHSIIVPVMFTHRLGQYDSKKRTLVRLTWEFYCRGLRNGTVPISVLLLRVFSGNRPWTETGNWLYFPFFITDVCQAAVLEVGCFNSLTLLFFNQGAGITFMTMVTLRTLRILSTIIF